MPPPPQTGADGGPVNVKVRRIQEVKPISSTAPPPATALKGRHRLLVVLVETADSPWPEKYSPARYQDLIFSNKAESMAEFWRENSYGAFRLTGEVVGPIRIPGRMSKYEYDRNRADGRQVKRLIKEALTRASEHVDLDSYDQHNTRGKKKKDGVIDHLMVIYAEQSGRHDGFAPIWPHRGSLDIEVAGLRVQSYTILNHAARLGVYVHEFGHDLGLPDLYDRDYSSHGAGDWCSMASGSWLGSSSAPAHISAWAKVRLGWIAPKVISQSSRNVKVPSSSEKPFALKIPIGAVDSTEYFLLENRRKLGFDRGLAAEGLLIWHIDEGKGDNDDEQRKMVDVVEATTHQDLDHLDRYRRPKHAPDVFSAQGRALFSDDTQPSARSHSGQPSKIEVQVHTPGQRVMRVSVTRPKIFDPGGLPFTLARDGYQHGRFASVPLGPGAESLVPLDTTPGGFLAFRAEAFVSGKPHRQDQLTFRIYSDKNGRPGQQIIKKKVRVTLPEEGYQWVRVRLGKGLKFVALQRIWVGVTTTRGVVQPVLNPFSVSKEARYRHKQQNSQLKRTFRFRTGKEPTADYVIRLAGFGYLEGDERPDPRAHDGDRLVVEMKTIDKLADSQKYELALTRYQVLLAEMERSPRRYATWIPVVVNSIGVVAYELRRFDVALEHFETTLRRALAVKDRRNAADVYENIGETAFLAGDLARAKKNCRRSYDINASLTRTDRMVENLYWLGRAHQADQQSGSAKGFFEQALVAARDAFHQDSDQQKRWTERIQRAMQGDPEDKPGVKERSKEQGGRKHKAVYTDLLQFLADDTQED